MKKFIILLAFVMQIFAQDLIKVGIDPAYAPFGYMKDGKAYGFDIDLVNEIAKILDIKVEFIPMDFDGLIGGLKLKKIDMIASGLRNTPERAKSVEFSDFYYISSNYFLKQSSRTDIIEINGLTIGAQLGSIQADILARFKDVKIFLNADTSNLILALVGEKIDSVLVDKTVAKGYLRNYKNLVVFKKTEEKTDGLSFAFAKGNTKLRDEFNRALKIIKDSGIYDNLIKKYDME
ncbi:MULTISPECIES: ABC transporter substrate-binding protein [unclassified Campylobacter]|uniref:ABC transporter substrate-binding protein n=1 Tax=unclassified Campylobacter TaxID=2593542 RepID=UPI001BDACA37|nr:MULTISPECIES: ABC transporter substrate-binding protein [unclassified Campylobacter]MBT0881396.1 ABC transporter substrate-binding protein [Campylobacter sp. 2018MI27]MBT0884699.1 ABC transporter substrate-binding protein [Campylobacter sp. 2018MI10]